MRILYVEDNETNQALVGRVVRARKHDIVFKDEGEGALEILAADPSIDLILLDIELAGAISGIDVVKTLRARNDKRPVVAVTAYAMMGDRERILDAGCDQYLPKPLVIIDLMALMDHYEAEISADALPAAPQAPEVAPAVAPANAAVVVPDTLAPVPQPAVEAAVPTAAPAPAAVPVVEPQVTTPAPTAAPVLQTIVEAVPPAVPVINPEPKPAEVTPPAVIAASPSAPNSGNSQQ